MRPGSSSSASRRERRDDGTRVGSSFVDRFRSSMHVSDPAAPRAAVGSGIRRWSPEALRPGLAGTGRGSPATGVGGRPRQAPPPPPPQLTTGRGVSRPAANQLQTTGRRLAEPVRRAGSPGAVRRDLSGASPRASPPPRPVGSSSPVGSTRGLGSSGRGSPVPRPKPPEPSLKVGIVLMTRKPHRFDYWLRYHRSLGIAHVFVHVEDTPELVAMLQTSEVPADEGPNSPATSGSAVAPPCYSHLRTPASPRSTLTS